MLTLDLQSLQEQSSIADSMPSCPITTTGLQYSHKARTLPVLDLSLPPKVNIDCYMGYPQDAPLNLSASDTCKSTSRFDVARDTSTPPKTPTTPNCTSYKKNILKRYSKYHHSCLLPAVIEHTNSLVCQLI